MESMDLPRFDGMTARILEYKSEPALGIEIEVGVFRDEQFNLLLQLFDFLIVEIAAVEAVEPAHGVAHRASGGDDPRRDPS